MWLQTIHGAYSINCADTEPGSGVLDPETMMIRARRRGHLENLRRACPPLAEHEIVETAGGDYRWRIIAPKPAVALAIGELVSALDYPNFKSECSRKADAVGTDYVSGLHSIWSVLARLQR